MRRLLSFSSALAVLASTVIAVTTDSESSAAFWTDDPPYSIVTLSKTSDGTGHGTSEQTFINSRNGYPNGDDRPDDGKVAVGDVVTYDLDLQLKLGPDRDVKLGWDLSKAPYLQDADMASWCTPGLYFTTRIEDNTCVLRVQAGALESVHRKISLRAVNASTNTDMQVPVFLHQDGTDTSSRIETSKLTVLAERLFDVKLVNTDDKGVEQVGTSGTWKLVAYPLDYKNYSANGVSTDMTYTGYLDVSVMPAGTTYKVNGAPVRASNNRLNIAATSPVTTVDWSVPSPEGGAHVYPVHLVTNLSTPLDPGSNTDKDRTTQDDNIGSVAGKPYFNNSWTRALVVPASNQAVKMKVFRPDAYGRSIWEPSTFTFGNPAPVLSPVAPGTNVRYTTEFQGNQVDFKWNLADYGYAGNVKVGNYVAGVDYDIVDKAGGLTVNLKKPELASSPVTVSFDVEVKATSGAPSVVATVGSNSTTGFVNVAQPVNPAARLDVPVPAGLGVNIAPMIDGTTSQDVVTPSIQLDSDKIRNITVSNGWQVSHTGSKWTLTLPPSSGPIAEDGTYHLPIAGVTFDLADNTAATTIPVVFNAQVAGRAVTASGSVVFPAKGSDSYKGWFKGQDSPANSVKFTYDLQSTSDDTYWVVTLNHPGVSANFPNNSEFSYSTSPEGGVWQAYGDIPQGSHKAIKIPVRKATPVTGSLSFDVQGVNPGDVITLNAALWKGNEPVPNSTVTATSRVISADKGRVWLDVNRDRLPDGESGVKNVSVVLQKQSGTTWTDVATIITDDQGLYTPPALEQGSTYRYRFGVPPTQDYFGRTVTYESTTVPVSDGLTTEPFVALSNMHALDLGLWYADPRVTLEHRFVDSSCEEFNCYNTWDVIVENKGNVPILPEDSELHILPEGRVQQVTVGTNTTQKTVVFKKYLSRVNAQGGKGLAGLTTDGCLMVQTADGWKQLTDECGFRDATIATDLVDYFYVIDSRGRLAQASEYGLSYDSSIDQRERRFERFLPVVTPPEFLELQSVGLPSAYRGVVGLKGVDGNTYYQGVTKRTYVLTPFIESLGPYDSTKSLLTVVDYESLSKSKVQLITAEPGIFEFVSSPWDYSQKCNDKSMNTFPPKYKIVEGEYHYVCPNGSTVSSGVPTPDPGTSKIIPDPTAQPLTKIRDSSNYFEGEVPDSYRLPSSLHPGERYIFHYTSKVSRFKDREWFTRETSTFTSSATPINQTPKMLAAGSPFGPNRDLSSSELRSKLDGGLYADVDDRRCFTADGAILEKLEHLFSDGSEDQCDSVVVRIPSASGEPTPDYSFDPGLEGVVWLDSNRNGIYEEGEEEPLGGVPVALYTADGKYIDSFSSLEFGDIRFYIPSGTKEVVLKVGPVPGLKPTIKNTSPEAYSTGSVVNEDGYSDKMTVIYFGPKFHLYAGIGLVPEDSSPTLPSTGLNSWLGILSLSALGLIAGVGVLVLPRRRSSCPS